MFSMECALCKMTCSVYREHILQKTHSIENTFSIEYVVYGICSLQNDVQSCPQSLRAANNIVTLNPKP